VPGTPVDLLLILEHLGERLVDRPPRGERGALIDRRADQRMAKLEPQPGDVHQPRLLGGLQRLQPTAEQPRRGQDGGQLAGVLGGGHQQQRLGRRRQPPHPLQEGLPQPCAQGKRFGQRLPAGQLLAGQGLGQLQQGERVPAGLFDQPATDLGVEVAGMGPQAAGDEQQCVRRRLVQRPRMGDQAQQRLLGCHRAQQAQNADLYQEPVDLGIGEPEGAPERIRLRPGQPLQPAEERAQQLPASPRITSTPLRPPRASSSRVAISARSLRRPYSMNAPDRGGGRPFHFTTA
jgi:hypothetical protein